MGGGADCLSSDLHCLSLSKGQRSGLQMQTLTALQWVVYEKTLECFKFHSDSGPTSTEVFY